MKFHKLTIRNIHSLEGEQSIDFDAELGAPPLFLIHGPTGSGKSSILDAISLALYGQTPRFQGSRSVGQRGAIDGVNASDPRSVMTRGQGDCGVVLEFSVLQQNGRRSRYKASWSLHRAHKNPDGAFQNTTRSLERWEESEGWQSLVGGIKKEEHQRAFDEALEGLSFDDFTRTILLAQFSFRRFLEADGKERASLLERLTGTEAFTAIGKRASQKKAAADKEVGRLEARLDSQMLASSEEKAEKKEALEEQKALAEKLAEQERKQLIEMQAFQAAHKAWKRLDEAQKALEESALLEREREADFLRLLEDEKSQKAQESLAKLQDKKERRAEKEKQLEEASLKEAAALIEVKEKEGFFNAEKQAQESEAEAQKEDEERLQKAILLWREKEALLAQVHALKEEKDRRKASESKLEAETKAFQERLLVLEKDRQEKEATFRAIPAYQALKDELPLIEKEASGLDGLQTELKKALEALSFVERQKAQEESQLKALMPELSTMKSQVLALEENLKAKEKALKDLVGEASAQAFLEALERELSEGRLTLKDMESQKKALEKRDLLNAELHSLGEFLEVQKKEGQLIQKRMGEALEKSQSLRRYIQEQEALLALYHAHLTLEDEREKLKDGAPCPLCGSLTHPYREDESLLPVGTTELEESQKRLAAFKEEEAALLQKMAQDQEAFHQHELQLAGKKSLQEQLLSQVAAIQEELEKGGFGSPHDKLPSLKEAMLFQEKRLEEKANTQALARRTLSQLEEGKEQLLAAESRLTASTKTFENIEQSLSITETKLSFQLEQKRVWEERLREAEKTLEERLQALQVTQESLPLALQEAHSRLVLGDKLQEALQDLEKTAQKEGLLLKALVTKLELAKKEREEAEHALSLAALHLAEKEKEGLAYYGGQDPEKLKEMRLEKLDKLQKASHLAFKLFQEEEQKLSSLRGIVQALKRSLEEAKTEEEEAQEQFQTEREKAGLPSEEAVLASALSKEERLSLRQERESLEKERHAGEKRLKLAREEHEVALMALPSANELENPEKRSPESLEEAIGKAEEALLLLQTEGKEVQLQIGALQAFFTQDERLRKERKEAVEALEKASYHARCWSSIHELIGKNEGLAFRDIVAALHLEQLIERANLRLRAFTERYELVQAHPEGESWRPLVDFFIIDKHRQNSKRTTSSLSGGESFIVSLALALALADMRHNRMRVETLLIDEGFGALDPQTLQDVLAALERLQAVSGVQIGLISHVEGMKEQVPAQIQVKPLGNGRSKLVVNGG